jgi:hypothetical protein
MLSESLESAGSVESDDTAGSMESAGSTESDETAGTVESYCYHSGSEILSSYETSSRVVTPMDDDSRK